MYNTASQVYDMRCCDAGMRTTRGRAQEETYSSSEEEAEDSGSGSDNSELESSPASSTRDSQVRTYTGCQGVPETENT